jgi:hypothetical protein
MRGKLQRNATPERSSPKSKVCEFHYRCGVCAGHGVNWIYGIHQLADPVRFQDRFLSRQRIQYKTLGTIRKLICLRLRVLHSFGGSDPVLPQLEMEKAFIR